MKTGEYSYLVGSPAQELDGVYIGRYTQIADGVKFIQRDEHPCVFDKTLVANYPFANMWALHNYPSVSPREETHIGSDVWIGKGAIILSGVTIGDGAIIGAYSVVAKDVTPFSVVVGNPAIQKRKRFDAKTIASLMKIRWWEWSKEVVFERIEDFKDIKKFIKKYG